MILTNNLYYGKNAINDEVYIKKMILISIVNLL